MGEAIPSKLCGRPFDGADLERIRREILAASPPLRSQIARQVCRALDWTDALGRPKLMSARVGLLETFVQIPRFRGTCYRTANWQYLGETAGRGKCDRTHQAALPRKAVYVYPLAADFRSALGVRA
jgi:hypothetical protein